MGHEPGHIYVYHIVPVVMAGRRRQAGGGWILADHDTRELERPWQPDLSASLSCCVPRNGLVGRGRDYETSTRPDRVNAGLLAAGGVGCR